MSFIEVFFISVGLAADAFAGALVRGLNMRRVSVLSAAATAAVFGIFQGIMPLFGYLAGNAFSEYVGAWNNYVAAALLAAIGLNMIKNSFASENEETDLGTGSLFAVGFATSVDACAAGISFALNGAVRVLPACCVIALTTFIISLAGVMLGSKLGEKYNRRAERAGGGILIAMGVRFLLS